jgi:hypothetical protein
LSVGVEVADLCSFGAGSLLSLLGFFGVVGADLRGRGALLCLLVLVTLSSSLLASVSAAGAAAGALIFDLR